MQNEIRRVTDMYVQIVCDSQPRICSKRRKDLCKAGSSAGQGRRMGGGGLLTVKSRAGIGVQRFTWIMANTLGRWPSLAPAKNSLAGRKVGQPGLACTPLSRATLIMFSFGPHSSPLHRLGTCHCVHALRPYIHKCRHRQTRGSQWMGAQIRGV